MVRHVRLTGQLSFENRGCEAIVRSTTALLSELLENLELEVPSIDATWDSSQWRGAADSGVRFCRAYTPPINRVWVRVQGRSVLLLRRSVWPFGLPEYERASLGGADAVLSVGGDNYSLDYKRPCLLMATDAYAMDHGVPLVLWGASVGPFDADPGFKPLIMEHLQRMNRVMVRENASLDYMLNNGCDNTDRMVDPAFTLAAEEFIPQAWPASEREGVCGVNLSSLVMHYAGRDSSDLLAAVVSLCEHAVTEHGLSIALIPHVVPRNPRTEGDHAVNERLAQELRHLGRAVAVVDPGANAAQLKHLISRCRYFVGARTHATIAAMSSLVPTVSLAYSVKAVGINEDVFGDSRWVVDYRSLTASRLRDVFDALVREEEETRRLLTTRIPEIQAQARGAAEAACRHMGLL